MPKSLTYRFKPEDYLAIYVDMCQLEEAGKLSPELAKVQKRIKRELTRRRK